MPLDMKQLLNIAFAGVIGLGVYFLGLTAFTTTQSELLGVIALLVVLWTNEALPLGVVSLLPIVLFPAFGIISTKATTINYGHPIIYLFLGGFLLAIAVEKSNLHMHIAQRLLSLFPATPRGVIFSLALTTGVLSAVLSNTTTTLLLLPIALFLTTDKRLQMRFALAIAYGASVGGILTPIGTPPNLILLGIIQDKNMQIIPFFQWIMLVAPLVFVMIVTVSMLLSIGVNHLQVQREEKMSVLDGAQKKVMYVLLALVVLLFVNAPIKPYWNGLGLSESGILLGFGILLFISPFKILEWDEDSKKIPFGIIFLFGAGFSIAKAFGSTGLADKIAGYLLEMTDITPLFLLLSVALLITFTTEITSNTALISIMLPVIYSVSQEAGIDARLFMMVATVCASYAFMLPIATPPNAIAMSSGVINVKDMMRYGFVLNLAGIFFIVLIAEYFWKGVL
jgi:sodium-dependent dicarboxylate transporter 2/3/5